MVAKLQKQAAEEATQEAFCQEENAKTKKARDTKTAAVDKLTTRIDKAKAGSAQLKQEIAELESEIADINNANKEATKIRQQENAMYKKASTDYKDSADAVTKAMEVLREFYGGAEAFVQQPTFASKKSGGGNMIVSFLETAQSDFTRLLAETEAGEAEAQDAFEQLQNDNKVSLATKTASVKGKNSEIKQLGVAIANAGSDLDNANTELDAILEYMEKLKPQCENKAMSYAERKARREAEIAGLKSALEILSGDEPAMLIQKKAFLSRK
jgi:predicted  nucleic acid-binding Zn-ribbon protein